MGAAYDDGGNVLGEVTGETKREVFEKLDAAHPDAAEIRIREQAPITPTVESVADTSGDAPTPETPAAPAPAAPSAASPAGEPAESEQG